LCAYLVSTGNNMERYIGERLFGIIYTYLYSMIGDNEEMKCLDEK
jgi:hypothetical protein